MVSKLGIHVNFPTEADRMVEFCRVAKPAMVLHLNLGDAEFPRRIREVSPNTLVVGRKYRRTQSLNNPEAAARDMAGAILDSACAREGAIDTFSGYNEIGPHPTHDYMQFQIRLAQRLHDAGMKYVAGSWSVGCPAIGDWQSNWMLEVLRVSDYIGVHEYCAPRMDSEFLLYPDNPDIQPEVGGYFTLRYRKWYPSLPPDCKKPLLITECGIDSGAAHWDPGALGGWRSFTTSQGYLEQLQWYDSFLMQDSYVKGAAIFCWGTQDPTWDTFDIRGEMAGLLQNYMVEQQGQEPGPEPLPDWMVDVRDELRVHDSKPYQYRSLDSISRIIIHHSAVAPSVGPSQIANYHVGVRDWPGIGYHFCVGVDGKVWLTNDLETISYHAGEANGDSIGVCLLGSFVDGHEPGDMQIGATLKVMSWLEERIGALEVLGHKDIAETRCPGDTFADWKHRLQGPQEVNWRQRALESEGKVHRIKEIVED